MSKKKLDETFVSRLRCLRTEANLSISQLAERAGISRSYLCDLEAGRRADPRLSMLVKLADALGVPLDSLRAK